MCIILPFSPPYVLEQRCDGRSHSRCLRPQGDRPWEQRPTQQREDRGSEPTALCQFRTVFPFLKKEEKLFSCLRYLFFSLSQANLILTKTKILQKQHLKQLFQILYLFFQWEKINICYNKSYFFVMISLWEWGGWTKAWK